MRHYSKRSCSCKEIPERRRERTPFNASWKSGAFHDADPARSDPAKTLIEAAIDVNTNLIILGI